MPRWIGSLLSFARPPGRAPVRATTSAELTGSSGFPTSRLTRLSPVAAQAEVFSGKGLLAPRPAETPHPAEVAAGYGGHELEFRRYLCIYTQIGLDLFEAGRLHAQRLVATYRRQVWLVAGAARQHFEPSFFRMSESYRLLPEEEQEVFWRNFDFSWGWSHMFVNMILAIDWHLSPDPAAIPPSNDEVSALLLKEGLDFDVPSDWEPHASG